MPGTSGMCIDTQLSHACAYEPFHAFPRHAGKFTPPKQGGGGGERRETESPITFSISGRAELSSSSRRTLGSALVLIINAQGSGQVAIFFPPAFPISPPRLICYSLTRQTRWTLCIKPLRREGITRCGGLYTTRRVSVELQNPVTLVHAIQAIMKYSD